MKPPVLCVTGKKDSGKTTVVVRLIAELARRGYRVMSAKHGHGFDLDRPGTDSWRHRHEGGAARVAMAGPDQMAIVGAWGDGGEPPLSDIVHRYLADADIVIAEGFKREPLPTIEVYRAAAHTEPVYRAGSEAAARYLAMATDAAITAPFPVLPLGDPALAERLADLIEARFLSTS